MIAVYYPTSKRRSANLPSFHRASLLLRQLLCSLHFEEVDGFYNNSIGIVIASLKEIPSSAFSIVNASNKHASSVINALP